MKAAFGREPPKVWHSLRHSFAAHYVMAGGSIVELQKLLGHHDITVTLIYSLLSPAHLAAGVARLSFAAKRPAGVAISTRSGASERWTRFRGC
jgi:integrase